MAKKKAKAPKKTTVVEEEKVMLNDDEDVSVEDEKREEKELEETVDVAEKQDYKIDEENNEDLEEEIQEEPTEDVIEKTSFEYAEDEISEESSAEVEPDDIQDNHAEKEPSQEMIKEEEQENNIADVIIVIPSYNSDDILVEIVNEIVEQGFKNIVVVDDGSKADAAIFFNQIKDKVRLISHGAHLGKGRALKTGINYALLNFKDIIGIMFLDDSVRYEVSSIVNMRDALCENPDKLILGVRDFANSNTKEKSLLANKISRVAFWALTQIAFKDAQCFLKAMPYSMFDTIIKVSGEDYEYEPSILIEARKKSIDIVEVIIEEKDSKKVEGYSHKRVKNKARIYKPLLSFVTFPLIAVIVDLMFCLCFLNWFGTYGFNPVVIYAQGILLAWIIFSTKLKQVKIIETIKVVLVIAVSVFMFYMIYAPTGQFFKSWVISGVLVGPINYFYYLKHRYKNPPNKTMYKN